MIENLEIPHKTHLKFLTHKGYLEYFFLKNDLKFKMHVNETDVLWLMYMSPNKIFEYSHFEYFW